MLKNVIDLEQIDRHLLRLNLISQYKLEHAIIGNVGLPFNGDQEDQTKHSGRARLNDLSQDIPHTVEPPLNVTNNPTDEQ